MNRKTVCSFLKTTTTKNRKKWDSFVTIDRCVHSFLSGGTKLSKWIRPEKQFCIEWKWFIESKTKTKCRSEQLYDWMVRWELKSFLNRLHKPMEADSHSHEYILLKSTRIEKKKEKNAVETVQWNRNMYEYVLIRQTISHQL